MTQDTEAPERVWILRDVRGGVHVFDERGDAPEDTRDDVEYVRADLLTAAEARAEAAEAERDALKAENKRLREALKAVDERGALDALEHGQQQADMDGIMVTVSRQAVDMAVSAIRAALQENTND